ncbi:MAG TPA: hypothetical protein VHS30_15890 [Streptosporangiaceae bacterium]|nr:hypothetical protein [Streptosporangiaceae bacterium]
MAEPVLPADRPDQRGIPFDERVPCLLVADSRASHQIRHEWTIAPRIGGRPPGEYNIRDAVEELIVDYFRQAIARAPADGTHGGVAAARNAAVTEMLAANPEVVNYMGRALLDPAGPRGHLLERLTELASSAVSELRRTGQASVKRTQSTQVIEVMIRQLGHLFLQPMLDAMWRQLADPDAPCADKPVLEVRVRAPGPQPGH